MPDSSHMAHAVERALLEQQIIRLVPVAAFEVLVQVESLLRQLPESGTARGQNASKAVLGPGRKDRHPQPEGKAVQPQPEEGTTRDKSKTHTSKGHSGPIRIDGNGAALGKLQANATAVKEGVKAGAAFKMASKLMPAAFKGERASSAPRPSSASPEVPRTTHNARSSTKTPREDILKEARRGASKMQDRARTPTSSPSTSRRPTGAGGCGALKCIHCKHGLISGIANGWTCDLCNKSGQLTSSATVLEWLTCGSGCDFRLCGSCANRISGDGCSPRCGEMDAAILARLDTE